jgi:TolB-like protein/DNA-binding winged helix-turn-helix (wHTH) protein
LLSLVLTLGSGLLDLPRRASALSDHEALGERELSRYPTEIDPKSVDSLRVGQASYDPRTGTLLRPDGTVIDLRSQTAAVLALLAARRGEVVTKQELFDRIWGDTFVTDDSLVQCVSEIRRAVGDRDHTVVQTLPKQGYRMNATADPAPTLMSAARGRPWSGLGLVLAAILAVVAAGWIWLGGTPAGTIPAGDKPRIAVLPFEDFSTGGDKGYLSDAIVEGIITELARLKTVAVIARNSSFRYREADTDIRQIGRDLGVHYLLEGSQQKSGDRLRVTAQLIDADTGEHIWAHTYDQEIKDLFTVQDAIIRTAANRVGIRINKPVPGADPERVTALSLYLRAGELIHSEFSADTIQKAIVLNEQAVRADPTAHYGYLGLALNYRGAANFGWAGLTKDAALDLGFENARKALELEPEDAYVHYALARLHNTARDTEAAMARFSKAIELNPSDSNILVASTDPMLMRGHTDEAIERLNQAMGIDPFHPDWYHWQMGWALWEKNKCDAALDAMRRMKKIDKGAHRMLAGIHACLGNIEEARAAYRVFYEDAEELTISEQRAAWEDEWTAPGSLDRWLGHMRIAGMRD